MALQVLIESTDTVEVVATLTGSTDAGGARLDWSVRNPGPRTAHVQRLGVRWPLGARPSMIVEHGWQSWSPVRVCSPDDVIPDRLDAPGWRRAMYSADPGAPGRRVLGDQFLVHDQGVAGFLGAEHHLGTVTVEADGTLVTWALLDGVAIAPGEDRMLDQVWVAGGEPAACLVDYADRWAAHARARAAPAFRGWCSWYRYGAAATPADVLAQLPLAAGHGVDVVQIDDGWQAAVGDWTSCSAVWRGALPGVADAIRSRGLRAGIWTAPFLAMADSPVARAHPDWFLRDAGGPVGAMHHPRLWGGWAWALDLTHPAVLDHLRATFAELVATGFTVHKLDFLYAGALAGHRLDPSATRAQALRRGLAAIREAVGDGFVLACGCPLGPAAGLVDAMRVSPDTAVWWPPPPHAPGFHDAASCGANAARSSTLRVALHRRLWLNDPDCLMRRHPHDTLTPDQHAELLDTLTATAPFAMISDDLRDYDEHDWAVVDALASAPDGPRVPPDPFGAQALVPGEGQTLRTGGGIHRPSATAAPG